MSESNTPPASILSFIAKWNIFENYRASAFLWYDYGLDVIPIAPGTKITSVKWDQWLDELGHQKINDYWTENSNHEIGFIVGDDMIVIDADNQESIAALAEIEARFGIKPKLVVETKKGEHHYYRRAPGTTAKSDSHSSEKHPDRLDIKTGRALVITPPSTGKSVKVIAAENKTELSEATQEFIDAIYQHNGRQVPSQSNDLTPRSCIQVETDKSTLQRTEALLKNIDPDCGYQDWLHVGMALFHETKGSDDGLALYDNWSRKGKKYKSIKEIENKWRSFRSDVTNPVTIGTLVRLAQDSGHDSFKPCDFEVINPNIAVPEQTLTCENPLDIYSLTGMSSEIEKQVMKDKFILKDIAMQGQATVIYAAPNTGKTLLTLHFLVESIKQGWHDPSKVYYINVDDTCQGLVDKLRIAEEFGFQMLAEGQRDFKAREFLVHIQSMIDSDKARSVVIILDTLKKFTDLMDKKKSSQFSEIIRPFIMKGGTVIALAHTNKNLGRDGKRVHAGTSDIVDDFDCAYMLDTVSSDANMKVVEFTNIKNRGNVASSVSYSYAIEKGISYEELLMSIKEVDPNKLTSIKTELEVLSDEPVIIAIESCIEEGINTKMNLAHAAAERAKVSNKTALKVIEKYSGDDPATHKWHFAVRDRGAKVFELLNRPEGYPPGPAVTNP